MTADVVTAVRLLLEMRGPTEPEELRRLLATSGFEVDPQELVATVADAGGCLVQDSSGGVLVALDVTPNNEAERGPGAVSESAPLHAQLERAPAWVLVAILVVIVAVSAVLLANLNTGSGLKSPTDYEPPPNARHISLELAVVEAAIARSGHSS